MLPEDQQRLVLSLTLSVILSFFIGKIKNAKMFVFASFLLTVAFQVYVFRWECIFLWVQQQIVYFLCKFGPRKKIGKIVLFETFIYLLGVQIRRMIVAYGSNDVDITVVLMMQVFLYVGFAYNYEEGAWPMYQLNPRKIKQLPPYFQYIGYVFFLPASMVGPVFQFCDFQNYIHRKKQYAYLQSTIQGILKQLKTFAITIAIYACAIPFPLEFMITQQFDNYNILYKIIYMMIAIFGFRFKYYSAWSLGMIGMNATGITFNPDINSNGQVVNQKWDKIEVSDIWTFEMDQSMKKKADAWNKSVQLALRRYIYQKLYQPRDDDSQKKKKNMQRKAQQTTLFVSALWHGLYPGYFISFFHWALLLQVSQQLFRIQRQSQFFSKMRQQFKYLELIIINFFLGYFGVCFVFMSFERIMIFLSTMYYIPVLIVYLANILIVRLGIFSKRRNKSTTDQQHQEDKDKRK